MGCSEAVAMTRTGTKGRCSYLIINYFKRQIALFTLLYFATIDR